MAHGKSQFATWFCKECNHPKKVTDYNKRRDAEIVKELSMFCPNKKCRKHTIHKRKDTKKGSANQ